MFQLFWDCMSLIRNSYKRSASFVQNPLENAECLIIPGTNGEDIALVPIGVIDGSILYLESHDLPQSEDGLQEQGQHSGGSKGLNACHGA